MVETALATVDLSPAQYRVLAQLAVGAEGSSALAAKLTVRPPTLTNVVDGLVQRGLVDRHHGDLDRRTVSYDLTAAGRVQLSAADGVVRAKLEEVATGFDDATTAARAFAGLELWMPALDAHRRRRAQAVVPAAAPAATAAPVSAAAPVPAAPAVSGRLP
jgi:DNA-binding MarR family transcriptional regulator